MTIVDFVSVLTHCQMQDVKCVLYICYTDSIYLDSLSMKVFKPLIESTPIKDIMQVKWHTFHICTTYAILIYFSLIVKQAMFACVNHARICSWNQPVLSNKRQVSCSRKRLEPLIGLELTPDRHPTITSQTGYPLHHAAPH